MPSGHNLQILPRVLWGGDVILKDILSRHYVEPNGYLKILIGCVWGTDGRGKGFIALQSLSTVKKWH
jgi:hypothetical protein